MKYCKLILKLILVEIVIIFLYIFLVNNYIQNVVSTIDGDGIGYYEYLPSLFIHHDLIRKDFPVRDDSLLYKRITTLQLYVDYHGYKVNKYPCGTALLQLPFFTYTNLTREHDGNSHDGYLLPFQKSVFYATLFYLFLGLFFLKKVLELFDVKKWVIIFTQLLAILATSVTNYANFNAGYSHVYSLFAISGFIYFIGSYFRNKNLNHIIFASLLLGLIIIIRPINIIVLLFIPFMAGSIQNFKEGCLRLLGNPVILLISFLLVCGVVFIQCFLWYLQTGYFIIDTYYGENFYFLKPQIFNILFSYKKGLFVYTPFLFISLLGLIWLAYKRKYYLVFTWVAFFSILTYVLSSWYSWDYGASYGLRAYIDYYPVFMILFALMLDGVGWGLKIPLMILSLLTIPVNIIQTYQYKNYILHWTEMDKDKYWEVFLKTNDRYRGFVWKRPYNYDYYYTIKEVFVGDVRTTRDSYSLIYSISSRDIAGFDKVKIIQVLINNDYNSENDSKIEVSIDAAGVDHNFYFHNPYLIHFAQRNLNVWQTGFYNFEFKPMTDSVEKIISLKVKSENQDNNLKNVKLKFICQR